MTASEGVNMDNSVCGAGFTGVWDQNRVTPRFANHRRKQSCVVCFFCFFYFLLFQSHIPTVSDLPVVIFVYEVRQITLKGSPISVIQNTYIQLYNHLHVIIQKGHQTISRVICIAPITKPSAVRTATRLMFMR